MTVGHWKEGEGHGCSVRIPCVPSVGSVSGARCENVLNQVKWKIISVMEPTNDGSI